VIDSKMALVGLLRAHGTESNVKDIYDKCHELAEREDNFILNQFSAFPNYMVHCHCMGSAFARVFKSLQSSRRSRSGTSWSTTSTRR